jgi:hypothetical protein
MYGRMPAGMLSNADDIRFNSIKELRVLSLQEGRNPLETIEPVISKEQFISLQQKLEQVMRLNRADLRPDVRTDAGGYAE